jgi:uncharacterized integral membrane protein
MKKENKVYILLVMALAAAILIIAFALQNNEEIIVSLLSLKFESTIAVVIIISFFIGTITAILLMLPYLMRTNKKNKILTQKLSDESSPVQDSLKTTLDDEETEKD